MYPIPVFCADHESGFFRMTKGNVWRAKPSATSQKQWFWGLGGIVREQTLINLYHLVQLSKIYHTRSLPARITGNFCVLEGLMHKTMHFSAEKRSYMGKYQFWGNAGFAHF